MIVTNRGACKTQRLGLYSLLPAVVQAEGFVIKVFTRDHGSPHVHVLKEGVLLKVGLEPVVFISAKRGRPAERVIHRALELVEEHRSACLRVWRKIHG